MNKRSALTVTAAGTLLVLALTLRPYPEGNPPETGFWCFFCDGRDVADAFLNLCLFIPLGSGLAALRGLWTALGGSLALSGVVEILQTSLPGRFPSLEDLVFNTLGGLAGAGLALGGPRLRQVLLHPSGATRVGAVFLPLCLFFLTALLTRPLAPRRGLYGQWTHELGTMAPYPGRILWARAGATPVPDGLAEDSEALREALERREPLWVSAIAGPRPDALSHLLAIYDDRQEEVLLLAVQGPDLMFQERALSTALLLDRPSVRWRGALQAAPGDTLRVGVLQAGRRRCLAVDDRRHCGLWGGVEGGWELLHGVSGASRGLTRLLGALWLVLLTLPGGFLALPFSTAFSAPSGMRRALGLGAGFGLVALGVSWFTPWLSPHPTQIWAPALGVALGAALRWVLPGRGVNGARSPRNVA